MLLKVDIGGWNKKKFAFGLDKWGHYTSGICSSMKQ